ncbi:MAG TPA: FtsX-like permease family protein [Hyphomicrobiales bacterium]|nr:FtsX-like permease family protein [Hyphomicrobiales bacterium]
MRPISTLALSVRLALRELRGGLRGFVVFIACLALGVAAIGGIGSVASGLGQGLARQSRAILGGDLDFAMVGRAATAAERDYLAGLGRVAAVASLRAMARDAKGDAALVEAKAVDNAYPLAGALGTDPAGHLPALLGERDGVFGAVADPGLLARLGIEAGDRITVGAADFVIRAPLTHEPDALSAGFGFGPRLLISQAGLAATGLIQPGSLVRWSFRVALPDGTSSAATRAAADAARARFPDAGWRIRTRDQASQQIEGDVRRFTQFLAIVALTALVVGGVGVANAVAGFVERRREAIAVLKCLGATGGRVFSIYLLQVVALALVGIAIGLAIGAALPFALAGAFAAMVPIPFVAAIEPGALLLAAGYGLLVALAFALWPLGRAHDMPVAALFRDAVADGPRRPRWRYRLMTGGAIAAVAALAVLTAADRVVAILFLAAAAATFLLLRGVALALMALARRVPRPRHALLRLALANIHRPGALTPSVVLSLGLGLTLLVALALIDRSIGWQLTAELPARAPSFFFVDIPQAEMPAFRAFVAKQAPGATLDEVPMLRGRITALKGVPAAQYKASGNARRLLRGDRGITFAAAVPQGSRVVAGTWWDAHYDGPPLVSFEDRLARDLGLKVGDKVVVNVLGRPVAATIANLRAVDWQTLGINFFMVFSPSSFRGAPYQDLATLTLAKGAGDREEFAILSAVAKAFPGIVTVRVKEALEEIGTLVARLAVGMRAASAVALLASALVLAGALAAGHRQRLYDAVILKTLGATRPRVLAAFALEYLMLGAATALFAIAAGALAAWAMLALVMDVPFHFDSGAVAVAALGALAFTLGLGLAGTWRLVGAKPAPVLRAL